MIVWIDLETTGLSLDCSIIEVACVLTDETYKFQGEFEMVTRPILGGMRERYAIDMHIKSGLWAMVESTEWEIEQADALLAAFINAYTRGEKAVLGGSSVHFDHSFIEEYMPKTNALLSYRHLDVSSLKIFFSNLTGIPTEELPPIKAQTAHRALDDINDSIAAAKFYSGQVFTSSDVFKLELAANSRKK